MRVLFLNQYFPPDPAPTGVLLREVADALELAGHQVVFAASGQDYRGGQARGGRMRRELEGLWAIFRGGMGAGKVDAIVSATSPPLLVVAGAVMARLKGARHYHWLFDMYPELATALGEIPEGGAARIFAALTRWAYRGANCVVALDGDMAGRLKGYGVEARVIAPWVFEALIEARAGQGWRLVFQGGGPSRAAAEEEAKRMGLARCDFRPYVAEDELPASLLAADVLVVTQKPETQGLLWPSKLALVASLPRAILWVGPKDGAIARDLARLGRAGVFAPGEAEGVARWLAEGKWCGDGQIVDPVAVRAAGLREWVEIITGEERAASPDLPGK